jgi:hypothetical protein
MSKITTVLGELAKRAAAKDEKALNFLHNTSTEKLQRMQNMGGLPMPSIAITDKSIPFENFGDITLVGKPESFDPKANSLNQAFSADAYTVRAPSPVRVAKKGAGKRFNALYGADAKELGVYADETMSNIWDLEKKGDAREDKYNQVVRWFENRSGPLFLKDKGILFDKDSRQSVDDALLPYQQNGEFQQWAKDSTDEVFEDGEYFISNPDRDYYTQNARLKPYTADEITKVMKRNAGRGGEGGLSSSSPGAVRAAYSEKLTSLEAMRKRRDQLSGDIGIEKDEVENLLLDLGDAIKPYYKYDSDGFMYRDAVSEFLADGATKGLKRSGDFVGFENIPSDLMQELEGFQQILKKAPTEYFESKPKRVVKLNEFGGAIVPDGTSQKTLDLLTQQGLEIESYADDAERLAARQKFKNLLFQIPPTAAATVLAGIAAGSSGQAEASENGASLMADANREFADATNGQGLGGIQQMLLKGIMQTAGMVDMGADVASSMAGPLLSAPGAIARYAADRFMPGTEYSAEDISQARQSTEDYFNYSPRTELGSQYGEQAMQAFGGAVAPYMQPLSDAAGNSSILGAMSQGYNYLGDKEKELAKAMMDISPI